MVESSLRAGIYSARTERLKAILPQILLPTAIFLWAISLWQAELHVGPYGLIHGLPPLFFVALLLLNASFLAALRWRQEHTVLLTAHIIAFIGFVDLMPVILEGTPRFPYIYGSYGYADYVVRNGHLNFSYTYHNWPALHLLNAAFVQVSGIGPLSLLMWAPLALRGFALLSLTLIFRRLCESRQELWLALWLYVVFAAGPGYLLPGNLAGLLLFTMLAMAVARPLVSSDSLAKALGYQVVLVILLATLVSTHLFTALGAGVYLALLYAVAKVLGRKGVKLNTTILAAVLFLCWMFYVAINVTRSVLPLALGEVLKLGAVVAETGELATGGAPQHTTVVLVRVGYVLALSFLALAGFLQRVISERKPRFEWALPTVWVAGAFSTVLLTRYGGEILGRAYSLAFFALLVLAAKHVRGATFSLLAGVVLVAAILYPINVWGNELVDHVPPSEIAATQFFYEHQPSIYSIITYPLRVWTYQYLEKFGVRAGDSWSFTAVGTSPEQHESFLRGDAEVIRYLREEVAHSGRVYDSRSIQILVRRTQAH